MGLCGNFTQNFTIELYPNQEKYAVIKPKYVNPNRNFFPSEFWSQSVFENSGETGSSYIPMLIWSLKIMQMN